MASIRAAAIQLESVLGDVAANLTAAEALADDAAAQGAEWILLPEFFTTGMGFLPALAEAALPPSGAATAMLLRVARRHDVKVGGSFLCRDDDGEVRNAFFLATPDGIAGRHDKDIPTQWESCWYVGGQDDGVLQVDGLKVGAALCLEFARTATVNRLRGVDLVVGGSFTWRFPSYWPRLFGRAMFDRRYDDYVQWAPSFARLVGAPVVEATHCGTLDCRDQLVPVRYRCRIGGGAKICAADGTVLAARSHLDGPGVVVADVEVGAVTPTAVPPARAYVQPRGLVWSTMWAAQRLHGGRLYRRNQQARRGATAER